MKKKEKKQTKLYRTGLCFCMFFMLLSCLLLFSTLELQAEEDNTAVSPLPSLDVILTSEPTASPEPKQTIFLSKPKKIKAKDITTTTVVLEWKKVSKANKYEIYRKKGKEKNYKKIKTTKHLSIKDDKLKGKTKVRYRIRAIGTDPTVGTIASPYSKSICVVTKPTIKKIAYVGDSVMCGMAPYLNNKKKGRWVIGKIGISTWNFWRGSLMDTLLNYNPDRMYIMLGVNSLVGPDSVSHCNAIVADYKKMIKLCKENNPDVDIIILSLAPCSPGCRETHNSYINMYNKKQKQMAKQMKLKYFDFSSEFKNNSGYLKPAYNGGDGLHWSAKGCKKFKAILKNYEKKNK